MRETFCRIFVFGEAAHIPTIHLADTGAVRHHKRLAILHFLSGRCNVIDPTNQSAQGEALPLPVNNRYNKRPVSEGEDTNNPDAVTKKRRRTGLLAHRGPLNLA